MPRRCTRLPETVGIVRQLRANLRLMSLRSGQVRCALTGRSGDRKGKREGGENGDRDRKGGDRSQQQAAGRNLKGGRAGDVEDKRAVGREGGRAVDVEDERGAGEPGHPDGGRAMCSAGVARPASARPRALFAWVTWPWATAEY